MPTRTRRAGTGKQQRSGVVPDKEVHGAAAAGGILASFNVNIPVVKNRLQEKENDKVPSSVMISSAQRALSHSASEKLDGHNKKKIARSFEQDVDDDFSAISCDVSPRRLDISRIQDAVSSFSGDLTMSNDSISQDLTLSLQPSEDETTEDPSSSPRSYVADLDTVDSDQESSFTVSEANSESQCETSESLVEESYDPGLEDDEYNPNEEIESESDEDLEFMEGEIGDSPEFTPTQTRVQHGEIGLGSVAGDTGKEVSSRTTESDDDSTVVERTPKPKSRSLPLSMISPEIQLAEIVDDDEITDNDILVATIIDGDQALSSEKHPRNIGILRLQKQNDGIPFNQTASDDFQNDGHEAQKSLLVKKDNTMDNQGRNENVTDSLEYYEAWDANESIPSNKPLPYHTPIQKKPKSSKKTFWLEGRVKRGKWTLGAKIGVGSFGVVHVGMNTLTGSLMAVKIFKVDGEAVMKDVRREVELMRLLKHQNIVQYLGAQMDKTHLHIFQEWVPGGSVASMLSRFGAFPLQVIQRYLSQTLLGLHYLHENNIIHRDIKGSNILVNDGGVVKLADFGASKKLSNLRGDMMMSLTVRGTPYFMAPEVFEERYSSKADIWGIGCVAFQMITASPPWKDQGFTNPISLFNHIKRTSGPPPLPHSTAANFPKEDLNLMNAFDMLMTTCFETEPSTRPSAQELLGHNFFDEIASDMGDDDSLHQRLFSPESQIQSPWSIKCKQAGDFVIPFYPQCKSELYSDPNHLVGGSEICSPQRDTSDWPEWAKDQLGKKEQTTPSKENGLSNMMGSLALSEDSIQQNPFARNLVLAGGSTVFSNLLGLQLIDRKDAED
ncbi:unnamed protein product [Cylindrotheca closterium]|uniref:Protein kinase domain-containing protein n=1 Tax=Cylindrotheca closterium TaxID=2856 RepID=A0AAD2FRX3_9STRA|nr:unnamed protein product [Cylindrotheca closterium]